MKIVNGQEMAEIDRQTIADFGLDGQLLMENAGRALVAIIEKSFPQARRLCVLCGPGNNGGDGFVVARNWRNRGGEATVFTLTAGKSYRGDALLNFKRLKAFDVACRTLKDLPEWRNYDLVVDALFGTGLKRPIEGHAASLIEALNASGVPVVAVDIASGVDAASGAILGCAVKAQETVTFGLPKLGHYLYPGAASRGQLHIEEIGFPPSLLEGQGEIVDAAFVRPLIPKRGPTGHKGSNGKILFWAGSPHYPGAACLCSRGALRAGAGLVFLAAAPAVGQLALQHTPELITLELKTDENEDTQILRYLKGHKALGIGPGFGTDEQRLDCVRRLLKSKELPSTLIDADALRALPDHLGPNFVITPHHGEIARLLEIEVSDVEADRLGTCRRAAQRWGCVVVLKGAPTLIADPGGRFWVNTSGHPVLGQGGTGDVLSGVITALLGQGLTPLEAAQLGVFLHGLAGERRARQQGDRGIQAHEFADEIPAAFGQILSKGNSLTARSQI